MKSCSNRLWPPGVRLPWGNPAVVRQSRKFCTQNRFPEGSSEASADEGGASPGASCGSSVSPAHETAMSLLAQSREGATSAGTNARWFLIQGMPFIANVSTTRVYDHRKTRPEDSPVFKVKY